MSHYHMICSTSVIICCTLGDAVKRERECVCVHVRERESMNGCRVGTLRGYTPVNLNSVLSVQEKTRLWVQAYDVEDEWFVPLPIIQYTCSWFSVVPK